MISGHAAIRDAYRNETVAREYVDTRFREPLGAMLHARQVAALERIIRARRPRRILEIAPGPGRLTVDISSAIDPHTALPVMVANAGARCRVTRSICPFDPRSSWPTSSD
jgi:hypothetical protein